MKRLYTFVYLIFLTGFIPALAQQQFTYTQYIDNPVPLNPAWSLTKEEGSVTLLGRKQWINVEGAPSTFMVNGFTPLQEIGASAGFTAMADKVGPESLAEFNLFFAKAVRLGDDLFLSTSITGGLRNYNAEYSRLLPDDPTIANADIRENRLNVGVSVMVFVAKKFYAGISLPRINLQGSKLGTVENGYFKNFYFANVGYNHDISDEFKLETASVLAFTPNVPLQLDVSGKVWVKDAFGLGLNYRTNNETAILTSFRTSAFSVGYSYSFVFGNNRITGFQNSTHEITFGIRFGAIGKKELRVRS